MSSGAPAAQHVPSLPERVRAATGETVFQCYQCGKCAAGCPLAAEMDYTPNQILRLLQLDLPAMEDEALRALSIWLCLTCETCAARCPQEVDLPKIMDYLRQESRRRGLVHPKARDILAFYESLLASVRKGGRLHEVGLVASYKLKTGHLFQDVLLTPRLLQRGKLSLRPHTVADKDAVRRIFERCNAAAAAPEHKADHA